VHLVFRVQNLLGESEERDDAHDHEAERNQLSRLTHLNGGFGGWGNKVDVHVSPYVDLIIAVVKIAKNYTRCWRI